MLGSQPCLSLTSGTERPVSPIKQGICQSSRLIKLRNLLSAASLLKALLIMNGS